MIFEGGAFGDMIRRLGHEDGAFINGISAPVKETQRAPKTLPTSEGTEKGCLSVNQEVGFHQHTSWT